MMERRTAWVRLRVTPAEKRIIDGLGRDFDGGVSELIRGLAAKKAAEIDGADQKARETLTAEELAVAVGLRLRPSIYLEALNESRERRARGRASISRIEGSSAISEPGQPLTAQEKEAAQKAGISEAEYQAAKQR